MWLIADNCADLIAAIPLAIRDEKKLEDVKKTDSKSDDVLDDVRYGLKSMLSPGSKPREEEIAERLAEIPDMQKKAMAHKFLEKKLEPATRRFFIGRRRR